MHHKRKLKLQKNDGDSAKRNTTRYVGKTAIMGMFDVAPAKSGPRLYPTPPAETLQTEI